MTELSKEYLDQRLSTLATKQDLESQTNGLKDYADQLTEKLAVMVADSFEEVKELLDVRERVRQLESDLQKIKESLHVS